MIVDLTNFPKYVNRVFRPLLKDRTPTIVLWGGAGSGKSHFICQKIIYRLLTEPGLRFVCARKTYRSLYDSVFSLFKLVVESIGLSTLFEFSVSPLRIACKNGSQVIFYGVDDPEKIKSIVCNGGMWLEECTELNESEFDQLSIRPRGEGFYQQVVCSFNPVSSLSWVKKRLVDAAVADSGIKAVHSTYRDNTKLGPSYGERLERMRQTNPEMWDVYANGNWGSLSGTIFSLPKIIKHQEVFDGAHTVYGCDFGFNDPNCLVEVLKAGDCIYARELVYKSGLTLNDFIKLIEGLEVRKSAPIYCDSSRPDMIEEMRRRGYNAKASKKGPDSIKLGINFLKEHNLYTTAESANLNREFSLYRWETDRLGNTLDVPADHDNHLIDAMRYAVVSHYWKPKPISSEFFNRRALGV